MADIALERGLTLPQARVRAIEWVMAHREVVALVSLMAVAAALRFWGLDAKALHHDESLHAQFTWYLYNGSGYKHDPLMHGPFLFHSGAVIYFLFGASDYTTRILPALFGTALVGMPYLLRKQLGIKTVLIAAVLLTFSPTLLYVSRFYRDDIYICVWVLAMVICIWRYLDEQRPLYLYILAAVLALSFATMEITFIHVAIIMLFLDFMLAAELGRRREAELASSLTVAVRVLVFAPVAWLIAATWPLLGKQPLGRDRLPPVGDLLMVIGTLSLPQFAAGIQQLPFVENKGYKVAAENELRNVTVLSLLLVSAYVGLMWRPKLWLVAAAAFYIPYVLLYTTFFSNMDGFFSGIWGSLDYWLDQHHVKRGNQPGYYYTLITPLYEFLPLLLALGGALWLALKGDSVRRWLFFWLAGILVGLTIAGEKMPWLEVHIAFPLALVAAAVLAAAIDALDFQGRRWRDAAAGGAATAAAVLLVVDGSGGLRVIGLLIGAGLAAWLGAALAVEKWKGLARAASTVAVVGLFTLTVRASLTASFKNDDTPVEMLVYTQTAPDIPQLRDRIDSIAKASGLGSNLPIVIDSTDGFAWPWAWYLRHYHSVSYMTPSTAGYRGPENAVLLVSRANAVNVDSAGSTQTPYKHRWWFNETYRNLTVGKVMSQLTHWDTLKSLGNFFLYRRPAATTTGAAEAVAYFPQSLAAFDIQAPEAKPPHEPLALSDGRIVIGGSGSARGELQQPADVFVDRGGDIWVADGRNHRIQKFDSAGRFLAALGSFGAGPGNLNEPWSVAVDDEGFVYVADTWSHRIQKFSPSLQPAGSWGEPGFGPDIGPLKLFGPRDIIVADDGTLWVTDTGNKRLINYTRTGEPIRVVGSEGSGLGQFLEPVGLARDASGRIYVADAWNHRVQRFEPGFVAPTSFETGWAGQDVLAKPYIAVLNDGRIVASDPAKGELLLFSAGGLRLGAWQPEPDSMPIGVAAMHDGGFVFSDAGRDQVQIVPATLIDRLFR